MNVPGCVGFSPITFSGIPLLAEQAFLVLLVKLDQDTGELVRNSNRNCVKCKPGEPGELIGRITNKIGSLDCYIQINLIKVQPTPLNRDKLSATDVSQLRQLFIEFKYSQE